MPYIKTPPGEPDGAFDLDLRVVLLDSCLWCNEEMQENLLTFLLHFDIIVLRYYDIILEGCK